MVQLRLTNWEPTVYFQVGYRGGKNQGYHFVCWENRFASWRYRNLKNKNKNRKNNHVFRRRKAASRSLIRVMRLIRQQERAFKNTIEVLFQVSIYYF